MVLRGIFLCYRPFLRSLRLCGETSLFRVYVRALILLVLCASAVDAPAADWYLTPSISLTEAYDSNFRFVLSPVRDTTKDDFITSITPVLSITGETELTRFQFDTTNTGQLYFYNPRLDTVITNTNASLYETWSPRFSTYENFGLVHDWTLEDQLLASGIATQRTERYVFLLGSGFDYGLTETWSLSVSGSAAKTIYPSGTLPNYDIYQASITPVWSITPIDKIGLSNNVSYTGYDIVTATTAETVTECLFWQKTLSETLNFKLGGGYYYSWLGSRYLVLKPVYPPYLYGLVFQKATTTDGGYVFSADVKKDWTERFSTGISAGKQEYNDASGNSFDSIFFSGTATYRLTELTTFNLSARYNTNAQLAQGNQKVDYYSLSPSIEKSFTENLIVRLNGSYEYETESSGGAGGLNVNLDRYRIWVDFVYKWPRFLATD